MDNYAIYDMKNFENKNSQYKCDKMLFNDELKINTTIDTTIDTTNLINEIYVCCFKEAYYYSWTYLNSSSPQPYPIISSGGMSYGAIKEEQFIKEHCVVSALYTVQYLLYKDTIVTASQLGSGAKDSGHNYIIDLFKELEKQKETEKDYKIDFTKLNSYIYEKYSGKIMNEGIAKLWELKQKNKMEDSYLGQSVNPIFDNDKKRKVSLFLSNISYGALCNIKGFNPYELIRELGQGNNKEKTSNFLKEYLFIANNIICNEEKSTIVDKVLFNYQKERMFNVSLMKTCLIGYNDSMIGNMGISSKEPKNKLDNIGLLSKKDPYSKLDNTDIELMKKCMLLPNAFSRNKFAIWFSNNLNNSDEHYEAERIVELLYKIIFPIYEKLFFIYLYDYCSNNLEKDGICPLIKMNNILTEYINNNKFFNMIDDTRVGVEDFFIDKSKDKDGEEKAFKVYEMLEGCFNNFELLSDYKYKENNFKLLSDFKYNENNFRFYNMPPKYVMENITNENKISDEMEQIHKVWEQVQDKDYLKREISRNYCNYVFNVKPITIVPLTDEEIERNIKNVKKQRSEDLLIRREINKFGFASYFHDTEKTNNIKG